MLASGQLRVCIWSDHHVIGYRQQAERRILDAPQAREQEVLSGRADGRMTDYPFSRHLLDSADWARLVSPPERST